MNSIPLHSSQNGRFEMNDKKNTKSTLSFKCRLSVLERLVLLQILPREGDFTTLMISRELRESLSFTESEHKTLNFRHEGNSLRWDVKTDMEKEYEFGRKATDIIVESLKTLDEQKKLTDDSFSIYKKFIDLIEESGK